MRYTVSDRPPVYGTAPAEWSETELASHDVCPKFDFSIFVLLFFWGSNHLGLNSKDQEYTKRSLLNTPLPALGWGFPGLPQSNSWRSEISDLGLSDGVICATDSSVLGEDAMQTDGSFSFCLHPCLHPAILPHWYEDMRAHYIFLCDISLIPVGTELFYHLAQPIHICWIAAVPLSSRLTYLLTDPMLLPRHCFLGPGKLTIFFKNQLKVSSLTIEIPSLIQSSLWTPASRLSAWAEGQELQALKLLMQWGPGHSALLRQACWSANLISSWSSSVILQCDSSHWNSHQYLKPFAS